MAGNLQPLDEKFPIVDEFGKPTLYFIKWCQDRQIDITEAITLLGLEEYLADRPLQQGSGIQITPPSGNIADGPLLIDADAQEILDQITSTRGSVLYRGAGGWAALAPGTSGDFLKTNGAGADPAWATASGGSGNTGELPLVTPSAANFTYHGNVAGSLNGSTNGFNVQAPNIGSTYNAKAISNANPASFANFTVTTRLRSMLPQNFAGGGTCQLFIRNSSNGRMILLNNSTNDTVLSWQRWQNDTTFNATINTFTGTRSLFDFPWRRIVVAGSSASIQISQDGYNWNGVGFAAEPYATYLTAAGGAADQVGVSSQAVNGTFNYTVCTHFTLF